MLAALVGLVVLLSRQKSGGAGRAAAIGCAALLAGGVLILLLAVGGLFWFRASKVESVRREVEARQAEVEAIARATQEATASAAASNNLTFGPVVERLLWDLHSAGLWPATNPPTQLLSLDTGRGWALVSILQSAWIVSNELLNDPDSIRLLRDRDIDLACAWSAGKPSLLFWDCSIHAIGKAGWQAAARPEERHEGWGNKSLRTLVEELPAPVLDTRQVVSGGFPQVLLVRTRNGAGYVVEATEPGYNPSGVKIRYKLVQAATDPDREAETNSPPTRELRTEDGSVRMPLTATGTWEVQSPRMTYDVRSNVITTANEFRMDYTPATKLAAAGTATNAPHLTLGAAGGNVVVKTPSGTLIANRVEFGSNQIKATNMKMAHQGHQALAGQLPRLRFLAWQNEWKTNKPFGAWHPDGSPVINATELGWLKQVHPGGMDVSALNLQPEPRFLHLWFSHPDFSRGQYAAVELLDTNGNALKLGGQGAVAGGSQDPNEWNGQFGWMSWTMSPGEGTNIPACIAVRLRYTTGPMERVKEVPPDFSGGMSLEGDGALNGVGQTADGKAFVAWSVDATRMRGRKMSATVVTKDGRELSGGANTMGRGDGAGLLAERHEFDVPLSDVALFRIGSRPIRTNEWSNVVLPGR